MASITVTVDGVKYSDEVEPRLLLVHYLRDRLGKTGTPVGCDTSNCGACTVHLNGVSVKSCAVLAVQADGAEISFRQLTRVQARKSRGQAAHQGVGRFDTDLLAENYAQAKLERLPTARCADPR